MRPKGLRLLLAFAGCCAILLFHRPDGLAAETTLRVLATTFPVYQLTRNITATTAGVEVDLLIPAQMGCPHDYALTPQDMRKLGRADVLVINGLGLEEFLGAPVQKANPRLRVIDSSQGVGPLLRSTKGPSVPEDKGGHHNHRHDNAPNPHLFASPRMAALMAGTIARGLAELHPAGAAVYAANGMAYSQRLNRLADEGAGLGQRLRNNRIVTQHGVFDYLARDMGLEVVAVVQAHAGQNPSASEILKLVATIKAEKAGALFTEPQYPEAVGRTIGKEAGIAAARLDPVANGPEQAPLDYYQQVMRTNFITLEHTLGSH